jgi:hypothetical protein
MEYTWIRKPIPVTTNNIIMESGSIKKENGICKLPLLIQSKTFTVTDSPELLKNWNTESKNDPRMVAAAKAPKNPFGRDLGKKEISRNPAKGKIGISQAKFSINSVAEG